MRELFSQITVANPLFALLLGVLPLLWYRWRQHSRTVILSRSLIFALLVLALTDPEQVREVRATVEKVERIFAFDLSHSVPAQFRRWMERVTREEIPLSDRDRVFVFGGQPREVQDRDRWRKTESSTEPFQPESTDLESLFSALLNLPDARRDVYLFTDGWETRGRVDDLLSSLQRSSLRVFPMLPPAPPGLDNVAIRKVLVPHRGESGETINLRVLVENQGVRPVDGKLVLKRNGRHLKAEKVKMGPGSHIFTHQVTLPGETLTSFEASFVPDEAGSDHYAHDNRATAWVEAKSRAKVLILSGRKEQADALEEVLKRRGFEVDSVDLQSPPPAPTGYGAVIFNNAARGRFSPGYLASIERYVAGGGAFLMLGGEEGFGPGGYRGTPIEDILPVKLKDPEKQERHRAVLLVIDKSGSMRRKKKLLYAKEAAKALAGVLRERDMLGVVGFDVSPFVVVPLSPLETLRGVIGERIDRLKPRGKTYLYPALVEAKRQLESREASWRHVIILSDGETGGSGSDYIDLVSVMREELKITVSAVAIGDQANIPLLRRIARYGGGLFHHTFDPSSLPGIVLQEVKNEPQKEPTVEKEFVPVFVKGSRLLSGFSKTRFPTVNGYVDTEIKEKAGLDLFIRNQGKASPFLASWDYGKGKSVVFTTDLHGRWTREWLRWRHLEGFWRHVFDWMIESKDPLPHHEVRINLAGDRPILDLYLYQERADVGLFRYASRGERGAAEGVLTRVSPGHYRTELPISTPGHYRIGLTQEAAGEKRNYPTLGYTLPFDPRGEIPREEFNTALLERLAQSTGGEINPQGGPDDKTIEDVVRTARSLRAFPVCLALGLFLLEVFLRRFVFAQLS